MNNGSGGDPAFAAPARQPERKPYRPPSLVTYGDLKQITQNAGMTGAMDGGPNNSRTGL